MDNANKALLIAGAVLLALLILTLSIYYINKYGGISSVFKNKIDEAKIEDHNNILVVYDGEIVGTEVINACAKVLYNNQISDIKVQVVVGSYILSDKDVSKYDDIINSVQRSRIYVGKLNYNKNGIIDKITFTLKNS